MKHLANFLFWKDLGAPWIVENSFLDCHATGVHSVRILEDVRIFFATSQHSLYRNLGHHRMSVGFHPHHCDVTLEVLKGTIYNITAREVSAEYCGLLDFYKYKYSSKITKGSMGFECQGTTKLCVEEIRQLNVGDTQKMSANQLHSVYVEAVKPASWVVYEGKEDPNYVPYCYSNDSMLEKASGSDLYGKPTFREVEELINSLRT